MSDDKFALLIQKAAAKPLAPKSKATTDCNYTKHCMSLLMSAFQTYFSAWMEYHKEIEGGEDNFPVRFNKYTLTGIDYMINKLDQFFESDDLDEILDRIETELPSDRDRSKYVIKRQI